MSVVAKLDHFFKQVNDGNAIHAEMKRITLSETSHYPWWKDDESISMLHTELNMKLKTLDYKQESNVTAAAPPCPKPDALVGKCSDRTIYIPSDTPLPFATQTELLALSRLLYDHFRRQVSMADIQYYALQCELDGDRTKHTIEMALQGRTAAHEQFPNNFKQLHDHFQHRSPKPSNEHLFQIWQQAHGDWDIILLI
jgi:hypothetical protein